MKKIWTLALLLVINHAFANERDFFKMYSAGTPTSTSFTTTAPTNAIGGASCNNTVFSIDSSSTTGACTISGTQITFTGVGYCMIDSNQEGFANYNAAEQEQQSITIARASQSISFTNSIPTNPAVGSTYTVSASGGASDNPVVFSIDANSTSGACSINGNAVFFTGIGNCIVDANQAGNRNYTAATQVQQNITITQANQIISFTSTVPTNSLVGTTYTVAVRGGASNNPVVFSIDPSSTSAACAINGDLITFTGIGLCIIDANQSGNANYRAAIQVQQTINISMGSQTISFTSAAPTNPAVGSTYTVSATGGSSGNPVEFTIDGSSTSGACSVSGNIVTFNAAGTCIIDANQTGNVNYSAAPQAQQSIGRGSQTISFTSTPPAGPTVGDNYTISATGGASGNPVVFSIESGGCSVNNGTISFTAAGICIVNANQAGNVNYSAAPQAQQSITVGQASQTITFNSTIPMNPAVGGTYTVSASGGTSGNSVVISIDANSTASACTINGNTITFTGVGSCIVDANQAGNANYSAALQVQQSITVGKGNQSITFTSTPLNNPVVGSTYTVSATGGSSGNPVLFSINSNSTAGACSINGTLVSFTGVGSCIVSANQAGNTNYTAAPKVNQSITIAKGKQTITFTSTLPLDPAVGDTYTLAATGGGSGNPVLFSTTGSCSISNDVVSFTGVGSCTVIANQDGNSNYHPAISVQQNSTVTQGDQTITYTNSAPTDAVFGGSNYTPAAAATSGLAVTITVDSSSTTICSISNGMVSFTATGTCILDANQSGNADYYPAPQVQQEINVSLASQTVNFTSNAPTLAVVGGATYTPTASASSGLPVTLTVDSISTDICFINDGVVSFITVGTCTLDANQPGDANYYPAPQVQQSFTITPLPLTSTMLYSSTNPSNTGASVTFTAQVITGGNVTPSGGLVSFTLNGTTSISGCSAVPISNGTATCTTSSLPDTVSNPPNGVTPNAVVATYTQNNSNFSGSTSATFNQYVADASSLTYTVPSAPTNVNGLIGKTHVTISWFPPTNTGGEPITGYTVTYGKTAIPPSPASYTTPGCTTSGALSCSVYGLTNNDSYTFVVSATNANGTGPVTYSSDITPLSGTSVNPVAMALAVSGNSRVITLINYSPNVNTIVQTPTTEDFSPALPSGTTLSTTTCTAGTVLAGHGGSCTITITPGNTASSTNASIPCTTQTLGSPAPGIPSVLAVNTRLDTPQVSVLVLGYQCYYQQGYLFALDDTTPLISSVGGTITESLETSSSTNWSDGENLIWGIDDTSTIQSPSPTNTTTPNAATLIPGQLNCDAVNDGACATNNITIYITNNGESPGNYAAGACSATQINNYPGWYLPSVCEWGPYGSVGYNNPPFPYYNTNTERCSSYNSSNNIQLNTSSLLNSNNYWTSTESSDGNIDDAWYQFLGSSYHQDLYNGSLATQCVRALTL